MITRDAEARGQRTASAERFHRRRQETEMPEQEQSTSGWFAFDAGGLATFQERHFGRRLGAAEEMEEGLTGSLCLRLEEASDAGAISGPYGYQVRAHAVDGGDLIIHVHAERGPWISHAPIDAKRVPSDGEGSFEHLRAAIEWILEAANPMLDQLREVRELRGETGADLTLLQRVARDLLSEPIEEEYLGQNESERITRPQFDEFLAEVADSLAGQLRDTVAAFNVSRAAVPVREQN
jgi:hypothetical protein